MQVHTGIEVLIRERRELLRSARVGIVVHPASVLPDLCHTADILFEQDFCRLTALFGPQHGARGEKQDNMVESESYSDPDLHLPVHSLYGSSRHPTEEMLSNVDVLLYDLQDVGTRVYTFIYTMANCMQACASQGKPFIVLDRPNPIDGLRVEGNLLQPEFRSFVGFYPIPMRHGMTVAELALFFNQEFEIGCDLTVVPMQGWRRSIWFDQTGLPWVQPSPNLPTLDSVIVYPGMVLVEGTCLSEGRGTTRPFEYVGAPFIDARHFAEHLNALMLPGVHFRKIHFQPAFQKHTGIPCGGVHAHVTDRQVFEPYLTGIAAITAALRLYPESFAWREPPYEYEYERLPIEILCGSRDLLELIRAGASPDTIRQSWQNDLKSFLERRSPYLLYD